MGQESSATETSSSLFLLTLACTMYGAVVRFLRSEDGPTSVEYAVMLALIAGACIASVLTLSNAVGASFNDSAAQISGAMGS